MKRGRNSFYTQLLQGSQLFFLHGRIILQDTIISYHTSA